MPLTTPSAKMLLRLKFLTKRLDFYLMVSLTGLMLRYLLMGQLALVKHIL